VRGPGARGSGSAVGSEVGKPGVLAASAGVCDGGAVGSDDYFKPQLTCL
jgi:hypothetical protein